VVVLAGPGGNGGGGGGGGCPSGFGECDDDPGTVCETDVTTVDNCGACAAKCLGAAPCEAGACIGVTELWAGPPGAGLGASFITLDQGTIYWTAGDTDTGVVMRVPTLGGNAVVLASDQPAPYGIATDGTNVYWANRNDASIMKVAIGGGQPIEIASDVPTPLGVAVDASFVYWSQRDDSTMNSTIRRVVKAGSLDPIPELVPLGAASPLGIALDATSIFWADRFGSIQRAPINGGSPTELASPMQSDPYLIAIDGVNVYWTDHDGAAVMQVSKAGGVPIPLGSPHQNPTGIAVDGTHVYWADESAGTVRRASIGGGDAQQTLATGQAGAFGVAVDATHVYWTTQNGDGSLRKLAK